MKFTLFFFLFLSIQRMSNAQIPIPTDSISHLSNAGETETAMFKDLVEKIAQERWVKNDSALIAQLFHTNYIHTYENGRSRNLQQILRVRSPRQAPVNQQRVQQAHLKT